jgi:hypothetical protein
MYKILTFLIVIFLFTSCEKSLVPPIGDKIQGSWQVKSATLYTNYKVYKAGIFVDSLVTQQLPVGVNLNHYSSYLLVDHIQIGDVWIIQSEKVIINNASYYYKYLFMTNFLQIYVGGTNRSFDIEKIDKNTLQLLSPPQSVENLVTRYYRLNLQK